ncbi:centrosomal protein [Tieghemostelium lacteum]|uniref:Centrosomal protein n=1 Tax=Tieghemostelium lacteum TaxID=361077 RepID=A0A151ZS13_TIELA|nr:centrosomal protein [Tieghemostelium lacteum]|eukprot:KYQ96767.1 centrosomal protein [Tieghemostelium lacteum]
MSATHDPLISELIKDNDAIKNIENILNIKKNIPSDKNKNDDLFEQPYVLESSISTLITLLVDLKKYLYNTVENELEKSTQNKKIDIIKLQSEIQVLESKKTNAINDIENKDNGILEEIKNTVNNERDLRNRLDSIDTVLSILDYFDRFNILVKQFELAFQEKKDYIESNRYLKEMESMLHSIPLDLVSVHPLPRIVPSLKDQLKKRRNQLKTIILDLFTNCIVINSSDLVLTCQDDSLLQPLEQPPPNIKYSNSIYKLVESLISLGLFNYTLTSISSNLLSTLIQPLISNNNIENLTFQITIENNKIHFQIINDNNKTTDNNNNSNRDNDRFTRLYNIIENLLIFICNHIFSNEKSLTLKFGKEVCSAISNSILNQRLKKCIPDTLQDLGKFQTITKLTQKFDNQMEDIGLLSSHDRILSAYVDNIEFHYAENKRNHLLQCAREIIQKDQCIDVISSDESIFGEFKTSVGTSTSMDLIQGFHFTPRTIFKSVHLLLELSQSALKEASLTASSLCCKKLYQGARDIFDLFRATYYQFHQNTINNREFVESITYSALYYNSCLFLSHCFLVFSLDYKSKLSEILQDPSTIVTFVDFSPIFKDVANQFFSNFLQTKLKLIQSHLNNCNQLLDTKDDNIFNKIESNFKLLIKQLNQMSSIWKKLFPRERYFELISLFIEQIISRIIKMILNLQNIEVIETTRLCQLSQMLMAFEDFYTFPGEAEELTKTRMKLIPSWKKLWQLNNVLEYTLSEIVQQYNQGKLKKLTNSELRSLVLSIFVDFDLRTQFLSQLSK